MGVLKGASSHLAARFNACVDKVTSGLAIGTDPPGPRFANRSEGGDTRDAGLKTLFFSMSEEFIFFVDSLCHMCGAKARVG